MIGGWHRVLLPFTAASGVVLAVLGVRRRAHRPGGSGPTVGERVAGSGTAATALAAAAVEGVGRLGSDLGAGAIEVGGVTAAMALRTAFRLSASVSSSALKIAGGTVSMASGLVVDAVGELLQTPFRAANQPPVLRRTAVQRRARRRPLSLVGGV